MSENQSNRSLILGIAILGLVLAGGAFFINGGAGISGQAVGVNSLSTAARTSVAAPKNAEAIIRAAYSKFGEYATGALVLELSEFSDFETDDLEGELWTDHVGAQEYPRIRTRRIEKNRYNTDGTQDSSASYLTSWLLQNSEEQDSDSDGEYAGPEQHVDGMSVQDVLNAAKATVPDAGSVSSFTSFSVVATEGENTTGSYKAVALWLNAKEFLFVDNRVMGVARAAKESLSAPVDSDGLREGGDGPSVDVAKEGSDGGVLPDNETCALEKGNSTSLAKTRTAGHVFGYDEGKAELEVSCECDNDCYCTAEASVDDTFCGPRGFVHMSSAWSECFSEDSLEEMNLNPEQCTANAAYACGISSCPFGIGSGSVAISMGDNGVEFEWEGVDIAKWKKQVGIGCACEASDSETKPATNIEER